MTFKLYWETGILTPIEGKDIIDAFNKSNFKEESLSVLSFYTDESSNDKFKWDSTKLEWIKTNDREIIFSDVNEHPRNLLPNNDDYGN